MQIKLFQISTLRMFVFKDKHALRKYVMTHAFCNPKQNATIDQLVSYLPKEEYYRVKKHKGDE